MPPRPSHGNPESDPILSRGDVSFSQCGEDLIVKFVFRFLGIDQVTYLDREYRVRRLAHPVIATGENLAE